LIKVHFQKGRGQSNPAPFLYNSKELKKMAEAKKFKCGRPLETSSKSYKVGDQILAKDVKNYSKGKLAHFVERGILVPVAVKKKKKK